MPGMTTATYDDAGFAIPPRPRRPCPIPLRLRPPLLGRPLLDLPPVQEASLIGMLALGLAWAGAELAFRLSGL
jgi:hypothetical protein